MGNHEQFSYKENGLSVANLIEQEAMDLVNYAGNNFAISSDGVTEALQRGGSVLSNYGVDLKDSIAMITGANELNMALLYSNI
jgi:hypothetical protein